MRNAIVLAAGKGTRMKSDRSKVMHTIIDRSMLAYIIDALRAVSVERIVVIVGYQAESNLLCSNHNWGQVMRLCKLHN